MTGLKYDSIAFGRLVRARRNERRWTQEDLAEKALGNRDRKGAVSKIESGKKY